MADGARGMTSMAPGCAGGIMRSKPEEHALAVSNQATMASRPSSGAGSDEGLQA